MRRFSGDPEDAYLLITWDEYDFERFLKENINIFPKPRGIYMILFISPTDFDLNSVNNLLRKIWKENGVLSILFKKICSSNKNNYIYDPFAYQNNQWGSVEYFNTTQEDKKQFRKILRNFRRYPLNVSLFERVPTAINVLPKGLKDNPIYRILKNSGFYGGLDGTVLAVLSEYLNFETIINYPTTEDEYGSKLKNGTFSGSLGDVINRKVAISMNARFLSDYGTDDIEFTTPVANDNLCLIVPSAEKIPQWLKIFHCFTWDAWLGIFGIYLLNTIYWYIIKPINFEGKIIKCGTLPPLEIFAFTVTQCVSVPYLDSQKIFFAFCLLYSLVITNIFQGSLVTSYTTVSYYHNIKTLQEFDDSGIKIGTSSASLSELFDNEDNALARSLRTKIVFLNGTGSMVRAASGRDIAAFERQADAKMRIRTEYTRPDGFELLRIVEECPTSAYVSYIVYKGSPYLKIFDHVISKFRESGLLQKWNSDTVEAFISDKRKEFYDSSKIKVFTLNDMQTAFYLLILGIIVASLAFIVEMFIEFCILRRYK